MKLKTTYNKCKSDPQRLAFLLKQLERDEVGYNIDKVNKDTYSIGPMWDNVEFPVRLFNLLKPHLRKEKEFDGKWYTYWELK